MTTSQPPLSGRLLVVGSSMIDQIAYCDAFPRDGETLVGSAFEQGFGGKGANQAVIAARLGGTVSFVGRVGDDQYGAEITANLAANGVDVSGVKATPGHSSGIAPIWVDRTGANRILIIPGANHALSGADVEHQVERIEPAGVVLGQLEAPQEATTAAFAWGRRVGSTTVLNAAPAAELSMDLRRTTDWLIVNESEFESLWGAPTTVEHVEHAAHRWNLSLVVTLGAEGAIGTDRRDVFRVPALAVDVVDTTGAGDAFVGSFAMAMAAGWAPADALRLAVVCGSLSTTRPGTQSSYPRPAEVVDALKGVSPEKGPQA
ncbi:MAG TPA: ribokinase [Jiangellaceae bacterium]